MIHDFTLLLSIFVATLAIRTSYELLKKAGMLKAENKPLFAVVLVAMVLMWVSWFGMCPADPTHVELPEFVKTSGLVLFLAGLATSLSAFVQLRRAKKTHRLLTTGLFSFVRHPIYFGFILWIVGWSVYNAGLVSMIAGVVGIANIVVWARLEEERLVSAFGEQYLEYRRKTFF